MINIMLACPHCHSREGGNPEVV
ncbi:hypothetical protein ACFL6L_00035 [candidate division KSB1 bacterium]